MIYQNILVLTPSDESDLKKSGEKLDSEYEQKPVTETKDTADNFFKMFQPKEENREIEESSTNSRVKSIQEMKSWIGNKDFCNHNFEQYDVFKKKYFPDATKKISLDGLKKYS